MFNSSDLTNRDFYRFIINFEQRFKDEQKLDMDRFKHFLIRRNLYAKFSNNLIRLKKVNYGDWIRTKQSWTFPKLIIHAFSWRNTPEGYIFWQEIMELSRIYEF